MAETLKRLAGPVALGTSAATLYTAPGDISHGTILEVHVCNESGSDATFTLSIGTDGSGKRMFCEELVEAHRTFQRTGATFFGASEVLQGLASAGSSLTITISGVENVP